MGQQALAGRLRVWTGMPVLCCCWTGADLPSQYPKERLYMAGAVERWHRVMPGLMNSLNAGVMEAVEDVNEAVRTSEWLCLLTLLVCLTRGQDRKPAHTDLPSPWQPHCRRWRIHSQALFSKGERWRLLSGRGEKEEPECVFVFLFPGPFGKNWTGIKFKWRTDHDQNATKTTATISQPVPFMHFHFKYQNETLKSEQETPVSSHSLGNGGVFYPTGWPC